MRQIRADLHNHIGNKEEIKKKGVSLITRLARTKLGPGGVLGITNFRGQFENPNYSHFDNFYRLCDGRHDEVDLKNAIYFPKKDLLIVRGEEVVVFEGGYECHALVLGTEYGTHMTPSATIDDLIIEAKEKNAIMGLDHPLGINGFLLHTKNNPQRQKEVLSQMDFLEYWNGEMVLPIIAKGANKKIQRFYEEHKKEFPYLGAIMVSDGHSFEEIASSWTNLQMPNNYFIFNYSRDVSKYLKKAIISNKNPTGIMTKSYLPAIKHATEIPLEILKEKGIKGLVRGLTDKFGRKN